jgi:hypothetical protein
MRTAPPYKLLVDFCFVVSTSVCRWSVRDTLRMYIGAFDRLLCASSLAIGFAIDFAGMSIRFAIVELGLREPIAWRG